MQVRLGGSCQAATSRNWLGRSSKSCRQRRFSLVLFICRKQPSAATRASCQLEAASACAQAPGADCKTQPVCRNSKNAAAAATSGGLLVVLACVMPPANLFETLILTDGDRVGVRIRTSRCSIRPGPCLVCDLGRHIQPGLLVRAACVEHLERIVRLEETLARLPTRRRANQKRLAAALRGAAALQQEVDSATWRPNADATSAPLFPSLLSALATKDYGSKAQTWASPSSHARRKNMTALALACIACSPLTLPSLTAATAAWFSIMACALQLRACPSLQTKSCRRGCQAAGPLACAAEACLLPSVP